MLARVPFDPKSCLADGHDAGAGTPFYRMHWLMLMVLALAPFLPKDKLADAHDAGPGSFSIKELFT